MPGLLPREKWPFLLIIGSTLASFLLLFLFRSADDNRLTSWKWAFADVELFWFVPAILIGIIFMYALLKSPFARQRPELFLFLFSCAAAPPFWNVPEVIIDASRYFTQAKHLEMYGVRYFIAQWGKDIHAWTDLPLLPFIYGVIFRVLEESRIFIQVFTSVVFALTVVVTGKIGKLLWDEETGFTAGALLWGIPYIFSQTPLMLVDVPTMFFLALSIYTFIRALQTGGWWIAFSALSLFCAVFSKYSNLMMLSVLAVIFLVFLRESFKDGGKAPGRRKIIHRSALVALTAGTFIGAVIFIKYDIFAGQIIFLREYQAPGLRRWGESFLSTFLFQIHPFITLAALFSLYEGIRKKDLRYVIVIWLIFLVILFQIRRSRYVMVVFPMVTLLAAYGLQRVRTVQIRRLVLSSVIAMSLAVAAGAYLPLLQKMSSANFSSAGSFLNSLEGRQTEVLTIASSSSAVNTATAVPLLDLYTRACISYQQEEDHTMPLEKVATSPLRFTWSYRNPAYYIQGCPVQEGKAALVIISDGQQEKLPAGIEQRLKRYKKVKTFDRTTDLFRYSPVVTVYLPATDNSPSP